MSGHHHKQSEKKSRAGWWITAVLALAVYAAGVYGFSREHHGLDPFYFGFQLFLIEPPHEGEMNTWIEIGRWGALALDMFAVVMLGRRMFAQEIARARLGRARNHFVVSAGVDEGRAIAAAIRQRHPSSVVAILDAADRSGGVVGKIAPRTYVVPGTVRSASSTVHLQEAAQVIVTGPDDADNLSAAAEATAIANAHRSADEPMVCQVQIQSVGVRETLRRASTAAGARAYVRSFDHYEREVTRLFSRDLPLDGSGISAADQTDVHVVIVGHGEWALAAASAAIRLGHFANGRPLCLSVITGDEAWVKRLAGRFESVGALVKYELRTAGPETREGAEWLRAAARAANTRMIVVIVPVNDAQAVELESAVRDAVRGTRAGIAVRLQHGEGLSAFLRDGGHLAGVEVVPFGWLDDQGWAGLLEDDNREQMAKVVQLRFAELAGSQGRSLSIDTAVTEWRSLCREDYKESNRQQVDHLWLKLRAVRCEAAPASDPRPAAVWSKDEIEVLSQMEHDRWVAERRLSGWRPAPEAPGVSGLKDEAERTSPHLVPWADLSEEIKAYDRSAVMNIPELLRAVGERKICRR